MKTTRIAPFFANIVLGLNKGYSKEQFHEEEVIKFIQNWQKRLYEEKKYLLSAKITPCVIVMNDQQEKHLEISFINYPIIEITDSILKDHIEELTKALMLEFGQNRVVVAYHDETVMFEKNESKDPKILYYE